MAWTSQQQTAINARGSGYIVSAAAGSGKTSVLVERLTNIIADSNNPVPVEKMIVVTFTVDAAAEMRQRLSASLECAMAKDPENSWLRRQQMLLPSANISTIHAFCFNLIREHIDDSEITSNFRILDDSEQKILISRATDIAISQWHKERQDDMKILWKAFCNKSDIPLEEVIKDMHDFFGSIPFKSIWLENTLASYSKPESQNIYFQNLIDSLRREALSVKHLCEHAVNSAAYIYEENNNVLEWVTIDFDAITMLCRLLSDHFPDKKYISEYALKIMERHTGRRYPSIRKKDVQSTVKFDEVRTLRLQYDEKLSDILKRITTMLPYFESDMKEHMKILPLLYELENDMSKILWKIQVEKNALSFDDGERLALKILSQTDKNGNIAPSETALEIAKYYELIMIDECQDSNNRQDYIFKLISKNNVDKTTGKLRYGNNIFMVGDVKQCIYQFRNANPRNFSNASKEAAIYDENSNDPLKLIRLSKNFRSSGQVTSFVNFLFSTVMTERCGEISYTEEEWLYKGADRYDKMSTEQQETEIAILPINDDIQNDPSSEYTAATISRMIKECYPVMEKDGSVRPCRADDFCILLRNKEPAKVYAKALSRFGIPVKSIEETGYLRSKEISIMLNLLRIIDNPLLETPMAAVMLSPMFSFTADDIAKIRLANKNLRLYSSMCLMLEKGHSDKELLIKCKHLHDTINELRLDSTLYSLEELIRRIYETTDFMSVMQLYKDGEKKRANLHLLLMYVRSYEENTQGGISGFLRYADNMLDKGRDLMQSSSVDSSDIAVSIKTMHGSKGLEFPFVFICRTDTSFSEQDNMKKLSCTDLYMAGMRLQNPDTFEKYQSLPHLIIQKEKKRQQRSEEMRLLYVALTRARQKLFIPLRYSDVEKKKLSVYAELLASDDNRSKSLALEANTMSDWIWISLIYRGDNQLHELVPEIIEIKNKKNDFAELKINYINEYIIEDDHITSDKSMEAPSIKVIKDIKENINFEYNSKEINRISLMSVSAISKANASESLTLKRPQCICNEIKELTGAEHGTAVHSFFQYAVFSKAECDPEGELKNLWQSGFITEEQMKTVRIKEIKPFFKSNLYNRIKKSPIIYRERKFLIRISDIGIPKNINNDDLKMLCEYRESGSMIKGIIDLAFIENNSFVLVDYKTDFASSEKELTDKYKMQLYIYSLALRQITGKDVSECLIYSTHFGKEIRVIF
ncbi:MAG: helicase-exonuclease AddAB subunit AddA [Ruminococcus sp.]|nr:helicase-exonuclease AddAB subunit AddA [Ruminococcus sp.]